MVADSLQVHRDATGTYTSQRVDKTAAGPLGVGVVAGYTVVDGRDLHVGLHDALHQPTLHAAGLTLLDVAGHVHGQAQPWLLGRLADSEVLWEAVLAPRSGPALHLVAHRSGAGFDLLAEELGGPDVHVITLGARHPDLLAYDYRWHREHPALEQAARLTRTPTPPRPRHLDNDAQAAVQLLTAAVAAEELAARPAGWPAGRPVAELPVSVRSLVR